MKNSKRIAALVLGLAMCTSIFSGCTSNGASSTNPTSSKSGEKVTLNLCHHMSEEAKQTALQKLCDDFTAKNSNIEIKTSYIGMDNYMDTVKMKASADDAYDFINRRPVEIPEYITDNQVLELDESLYKDVNKSAAGSMKIDGKYYGVPLDLGGKGIFYNKDIFESAGVTKAPETLDELFDACDKIQAKGVTPVASGFKEGWCEQMVFEAFVFGSMIVNNKDFFEKTGTGESFGSYADFKAAADASSKILNYTSKTAYDNDYSKQVNEMATGSAAMVFQGSWIIPEILKVNKDVNLGYFGGPLYNDASKNAVIGVVDDGLMVSSRSKHPEEAKAFAAYLMTKDASKIWADNSGCLPAVNDVDLGDANGCTKELLEKLGTDKAVFYEEYPNYSGQMLDEYNKQVIGWGAIPKDSRKTDDLIKNLDNAFKNIISTQG